LPSMTSTSKLSRTGSLSRAGAWGVYWGTSFLDEQGKKRGFRTGDRRLIVRTLSLHRTTKETNKRADGHLWPKGTFLQLVRNVRGSKKEKVLSILQRKQQSHDPSEWKGMSHPLDLTAEIEDTKSPIEVKIASKEIVENSDGATKGTLIGSFCVHTAICEYVTPDDLYEELLGKKHGEVSIPRISLKSAKKMAKEYMAGQMVLIDDSDEDTHHNGNDSDREEENAKSLTFSLLCPISKKVMQTPVRGRHCKHMQCMDLRNFLHANKNVTGGRWRCGVCESFVSVRELVHCGLFQAMLDSLGNNISGSRDRVSLRSDGSWKIMAENRLRYSKRGAGMSTEANNANAGYNRPLEPEMIDLL